MTPLNPLGIFWTVLVPLSNDIPDPNDVKPGWVGATVIVLLGVAVVVLAFSFRKQVRKADRHFLEPEDDGSGGTTDRGEDPGAPRTP